MSRWDPDSYLRFEHERTLPSHDLVARIELPEPKAIVDIGCGPGNSTRVLRDAWPGADVVGLDNSEEMIEKAQATYPGGRWILADAADWHTDEKFDLVFSNATLQWIPNHEKVLHQLFDRTNGNGILAAQVPFNTDSPLLKALLVVSESPKWRGLMIGCAEQIFYRDEAYYYGILSRLAPRVEMWMTTYFHIMQTHWNLVEWYASTGMKMYLDRIDIEDNRRLFKSEILEACKPQYPFQKDGKILFPFQRLFFIAYKAAET